MSALSKCGSCKHRDLSGADEPCLSCLNTSALANWQPASSGPPPKLTDTDRLEWVLPILSGDDHRDVRTLAVVKGITDGLTGRALVDYAMGVAP